MVHNNHVYETTFYHVHASLKGFGISRISHTGQDWFYYPEGNQLLALIL